ncbi:MAG: discoidin domain-containing protein [Chthonomonadales bacterium]
MEISLALVFVGVAAVACAGISAGDRSAGQVTAQNQGFRLTMRVVRGSVHARLEILQGGFIAAEGPMVYRAQISGPEGKAVSVGLQNPELRSEPGRIVVQGMLGSVRMIQTFDLPQGLQQMEERIVLRNTSPHPARFTDLEVSFQRPVVDQDGHSLAGLTGDRFAAVPLRHRATDPKGFQNDFSLDELFAQPGWYPQIDGFQRYRQVPWDGRIADGWAWIHGSMAMGIFAWCADHLRFSVITTRREGNGGVMHFGGLRMVAGEPAVLTRLVPGAWADTGVTRYVCVPGGWKEAAYAYRSFLDAHGCRFPRGYNPPIHWEQLYDMEGAWDHRKEQYTLAALEREAEKGREYSCEALYLDPGWDTAFATFLWDEDRLGAQADFVRELRRKYDLALALHCPLATWMSVPFIMGPSGVDTWPPAAKRIPPEISDAEFRVPAVRNGRRNLALMPAARAEASSVYDNGRMEIHQVAHLNDGWYGNERSWIAGAMPAWAQVDLGAVYRVGSVALGNEHFLRYTDRAATHLRIYTAQSHMPSSSDLAWELAADVAGRRLAGTEVISFPPREAQWVRVEILAADEGLPRLDEIEVYEADPCSEADAAAFERSCRRGPAPKPASDGPLICLGSRQYLDEAEKRLLKLCSDGAVFLMFDGNWWNGGCINPDHGHPVPYTWEDHIQANLTLARRIHAHFPRVFIEMHDMLAGGSPVRMTPVYAGYSQPGSYNDNWGFELMWDPMADIKEGRAEALYDYNLGCNVPLYLHIDLRKDNRHCLVLWWYASTCRHLGIGGTHADATVAVAQKAAMKRYRSLERFFKRGDFFGINPQIHLHVLPREHAAVIVLFNLSDRPETVAGAIGLGEVGLDPGMRYRSDNASVQVRDGRLLVSADLEPWDAAVAFVRPADGSE